MSNDSETIRRIRRGDKQEFEKLFRSSYVSLVRYARILLKDHDMAEEIVQDLFFRLWQDRETLFSHRLNRKTPASMQYGWMEELWKDACLTRHPGT